MSDSVAAQTTQAIQQNNTKISAQENEHVQVASDSEDEKPLTSLPKTQSSNESGKSSNNGKTLEPAKKVDALDDEDDLPLNLLAKKTAPNKRIVVTDDDDIPLAKIATPNKDSNVTNGAKSNGASKDSLKQKDKTPVEKSSTGSSGSVGAKKEEKKTIPLPPKKNETKKDNRSVEETPKKSEPKKEAPKAEVPPKKAEAKKTESKHAENMEVENSEVSTSKPENSTQNNKMEKSTSSSISTPSASAAAASVQKKADSTPKAKTPAPTPPKRKRENDESPSPSKKTKTSTPKKRKQESEVDSESESESSSSSSESESESGSESSSSEDDVPLGQLVAKKTPKKSTPTKSSTPKISTPPKRAKKSKTESKEGDETKKRRKKDEEPEYKWWLEPALPAGKKWRTLEHSGVLFPPPYEPHGVKMWYEGKPVELTPPQEELATFYAQYIESDHIKKEQFRKNFWKEFQKLLKVRPKGEKIETVITKFEKCDFKPIYKYLIEKREAKKNRPKEEKEKEKEEKDLINEKYGFALVDGHKQKVANYRIEPPGLFLGRGNHPKAGMVKRRVMPEDITLNIGKHAKVPECPIPGHKWGKIEHNDEVAWLAMWKDTITNNFKYVWLAASSRVKQESDMKKFETARNLKKHIADIRDKYTRELKAKEMEVRQRATALYVIDHLALRVGNEKDEDEADTVGCCSLRVEHVKLKDPNIVKFDFLGKDSMRYQNSVLVDEQVFKNFKIFTSKKKPEDEIFDCLTTSALNKHLKEQMDGLTAKVFRTFNASITLERELAKVKFEDEIIIDEKMLAYNRANREVAILCNHQRTVSKNFSEQMGKIDEKITECEDEKKKLKERLKEIKSGKKPPKEEYESEEDENGEKKKKKRLPDDPEKIEKAIQRIDDRIAKWNTKKTEKDELKQVSLTTSKINYIDPRISVAWAKANGVPIEKIFSKTLRQKFPWAMDVDSKYRF